VTKPVGTGPYLLEEHNPGSWTRVKRNPGWWFGRSIGHPDMPYFDGILTTVIPDPAVTFANLKAEKIHGMSLSKAQFDIARKDPNLKVFAVPLNTVRGYRFNHSRQPFSDLRVRQAAAYAIDRKALVAGIEFGLGRVATCAYPEDHWAHNPDLKPWPHDPEKARRLLREAGYEKGLAVSGYVFSDPQARARAEAVKGMLAEVGIDWKVDFLDPAAAAERMKKRDYQLAYGDYTYIFDPDLLATSVYDPKGGYNFGRSRNAAAIVLLEAGRLEVDMEKRRKIYHRLEQVLYESCEDIWLFWEMAVTAYRKNVMGYDYEMAVRHKRIWETSHPFWFQGGKP
jgi:peptide/nickel transport system substrate-binding protein